MADPLFTLDDLEPERPTIGINRREPAGPWQRLKRALLPWFPNLDVRYELRRDLYPLRLPSEFGIQLISRLSAMQREAHDLEENTDPASLERLTKLLREMAGMVLDAPAPVLDRLMPEQHVKIIVAFPAAVTGTTPTRQPTENPSTSAASSPASAVSTAPMSG